MTRLIRAFVAALVLALPALMLPASALANGSTVSSFSFKDLAADAVFQSREGCVQTTVVVFAVDGQVKQSGSRTEMDSFASVFIDVFDVCTGELYRSAFGQAELAPDDFTISPNLSTASLTTSIEVFDFVSSTSFTVDIDMDWAAGDETLREKGRTTFTSPGFRVTNRFDQMSRNATATGTVSDGCPNYTPGASQFARLLDARSATKIVEKQTPPVSPPISPPESSSSSVSPPVSPPEPPPCPTAGATTGSLLSSPTALLVESGLAGILLIAFGAGLHAARSARVGTRAREAAPARAA